MNEPWVEKSFLIVRRYHYKDGSKDWGVCVFGVHLLLPADKPEISHSGFMLSLYSLLITRRHDSQGTFRERVSSFRTIPLLQYFLGENKSHEIPYPETRRSVVVGGKEYFITKVWRYDCYTLFERYMAIGKSKRFVYVVESIDDPDVPDFSFGPDEWDHRTPTDHEIINTAKDLKRLVKGIGEEE